MAWKHWGIGGTLLGIVLTAWACTGEAQQPGPAEKTGEGGKAQQPGTVEKAGERIDDALRDVKRGAREAAVSVREHFAKARDSVHSMGIEARIYGRIHWDKALYEAMIDLDVDRGGAATLRGVVADPEAKAKAVALARDTVGVTRVVDQLTISPTPRTPETTPAAPKP